MFIITQTPLKSTKDDFWKLVHEHGVRTIVMMNNKAETEVRDYELFLINLKMD